MSQNIKAMVRKIAFWVTCNPRLYDFRAVEPPDRRNSSPLRVGLELRALDILSHRSE